MLDNPPHTAQVFVEETVLNSRGEQVRQPSSRSVEIKCLVMPLGARRDGSIGSRTEHTYSLITRDRSITHYSRVIYNGISCSVQSIEDHVSSPTTAHFKVILRQEE